MVTVSEERGSCCAGVYFNQRSCFIFYACCPGSGRHDCTYGSANCKYLSCTL